MQIVIAGVFLALVLGASCSTLEFNVSQSGSITAGSEVTYDVQNTLEADGTPTAFYVLLDSDENCTIEATTQNSNPQFVEATNTSFPSLPQAVFYFTPPPTDGATLNWTVTLRGIDSSCAYKIQARNMPALPINFGQTYSFENTEPFGFVRFSTGPKDIGKPFPAVMFAIGVSTSGNTEYIGCEANTWTNPSIGSNAETWFIGDSNVSYDPQWGIYSSTPNAFIESASGFFPSAAVPLSFYIRTNWNNSVACPSWNVTLYTMPPTPLKVGQSPLTVSHIHGDAFDSALIFGPSGAQSYSLVLSLVTGDDCPVGLAANDPGSFTGQGNFQVSGGVQVNATNPTVTVPVSGTNAASYIWTAYLDNAVRSCAVSVSFQ
jgi:hypothetical protein